MQGDFPQCRTKLDLALAHTTQGLERRANLLLVA